MGQFLCPSSGVFHCTHSNGICHTGLLTACEHDQDGTLSWSCSQAVSKPVWHIPLLCVQWKTPDDGQRNCPKHAEFYFKNKFEKLVHLVGFIIRILIRIVSQLTPWCMLHAVQHITKYRFQHKLYLQWWLQFITVPMTEILCFRLRRMYSSW